jgi:hypothetical protein
MLLVFSRLLVGNETELILGKKAKQSHNTPMEALGERSIAHTHS